MTRRLVYIAAPYGAPTAEGRLANVRAAEALARYAVTQGYAPIVVHSWIEPVFGDDSNLDARQIGIGCDLAVLRAVARSGGALWVLTDDDGSRSPGVLGEIREWHREQRTCCADGPWLRYEMHIERTASEWRALGVEL